MKNKILIAAFALLALAAITLPVHAQDKLIDSQGEHAAIDAGKAFAQGATNVASWDVAPYATYFPNNKHAAKIGGGVYVQYKIMGSDNFSAGIGLDWLGRLTMPSGNVTVKKSFDIGKRIGFAENKLIVVPFALAGIATPLSGAGGDNGGIAAIAGGGAFIPIRQVKLFGRATNVSLGYAGIKWVNAGIYDGLHHELFANFSF